VRTIKLTLVSLALCLASTSRVLAQAHDRFEGWCDSLQNATPPDLAQYLNGVVPDENNAHGVTGAIHRLGEERYEPAISPLAKLWGFRQPQTEME
jgi:hypothetical protein